MTDTIKLKNLRNKLGDLLKKGDYDMALHLWKLNIDLFEGELTGGFDDFCIASSTYQELKEYHQQGRISAEKYTTTINGFLYSFSNMVQCKFPDAVNFSHEELYPRTDIKEFNGYRFSKNEFEGYKYRAVFIIVRSGKSDSRIELFTDCTAPNLLEDEVISRISKKDSSLRKIMSGIEHWVSRASDEENTAILKLALGE